jgi:hypothetical protein
VVDIGIKKAQFYGMARAIVEALAREPKRGEPLTVCYAIPGRLKMLRRTLGRVDVRACRALGTVPKVAEFLRGRE